MKSYEQKYKAALEWMQGLYSGLHGATKEEAEHYFPELKESKDERIRKTLIEYIKGIESWNYFLGISKEQMIAWLEKQGENKSVDKPKFKVGDWITDGYIYYKITEILDDRYIIESKYDKRGAILFEYENRYHLWTIADAKDGDVLMTTKTRNCPFIYRKTDYNNNLAYYYAGVDGNGDFCEGCLKRTIYHFGSVSNVVPATKEQRDLLFQKMKEAGYEWDSEKKELKKMEIKSKNFEPKTLDADKVIEWLKPYSVIEDNIINEFKKDFGL